MSFYQNNQRKDGQESSIDMVNTSALSQGPKTLLQNPQKLDELPDH